MGSPGSIERDGAAELTVEEAAARLGVPASLLLRRIEAGAVPARRVGDADGVWRLRPGDLGLDPEEPGGSGATTASGCGLAPVSAAGRRGTATSAVGTAVEAQVELTAAPAATAVDALVDRCPEPRELVASLLEGMERTLERRLRQEAHTHLSTEVQRREARVGELERELETVRSRQAAALGMRDRVIADQERLLRERDAELEAARRELRECNAELEAARRRLRECERELDATRRLLVSLGRRPRLAAWFRGRDADR